MTVMFDDLRKGQVAGELGTSARRGIPALNTRHRLQRGKNLPLMFLLVQI